jgi:hypothetical protein
MRVSPKHVTPGRPMSSGDVARELVDLLEGAKPVPLLRAQIRIDKREVYRLVEVLRKTLTDEQANRSVDDRTAFELLTAAEGLREAAYNAYPVPLTDQVRLHRDRAANFSAAIRKAARLMP